MISFIPDNCPVLRILVPFALGVAFGDQLFFQEVNISLGFMGLSVFLLSFVLGGTYLYIKQYTFRWVFGFVALLYFFFFGLFWSNICLQQEKYDYPGEETVYKAVITDAPEAKEKSILCRAHITARYDSLAVTSSHRRQVLLYFPLDSAGKAIRNGDEILLSASLALPANNNNPEEFDYNRYLRRKGVYATAFVPSGKWRVTANHPAYSVRKCASDCRDNILSIYRSLGFDGEKFAILSALTVGYKNELSEEIREAFSVSGVSHVLAVSGLHVGFLYMLLLFFFKKISRYGRLSPVLCITFTVLLLWAYAFITGLSPSVVRSVIMFSLLAVSAHLSIGRNVPLNTLSVAAMGMLIYNPSWLFDVGFQLSFSAVAAIILIQPWLYAQVSIHNKLLDKLWKFTTVSVSAQIGTAPLVLLYFSRFSVHFLLTNVLIIPLVTIVMYGAVLMLAFSFIPAVSTCIAFVLNGILDVMIGVVRGVEQLPFASIDGVWVSRVEIYLFYISLLFVFGYLLRRKATYLIAGLAVCCVLSVYHLYLMQANRPAQSVVFYNVRNCPVVHCIFPDGRSWLAYADTVPDEKRLVRTVSGYWNRSRLSSPVKVVADCADAGFVRHNNIVLFGDKRIGIVNDNRWNTKKAESPLSVDYLYVCKGYDGRVAELLNVFSVRYLVLDSSFSMYRRQRLQEECRQLGVSYISLSEEGAYKTLI